MLECVICFRRYSAQDVISGLYWIHTGVCSHCYAFMQKRSHKSSCFGKPSVANARGTRLLGYHPKAVECGELCPDRNVCRRIVWGRADPV